MNFRETYYSTGAMIEEHSAGIITYREEPGGREYLLLHYPGGHFDFPKGHIEKGESEHEAAKRELKEETGIDDFIWIEGYKETMHYNYRHGPNLMSKYVVFFLARTKTKEVILSDEHQGSIWLPYEQAYKKLTFQSAKDLLEKGEKFLKR